MKVHASPTKEFFVDMITKDISLEACILDLVDNSLDGARADLRRRGGDSETARAFEGYWVQLTLRGDHFSVADNCGGISIEDAVNYAFHFGRRRDADREEGGIGLYGIGMKRAVFKLGREITVSSSTTEEGFIVPINVLKWLEDEHTWDFELTPADPWDEAGTRIAVSDLNAGVSLDLSSAEFITNRLVPALGRDYSFYLQKGFTIEVNGTSVRPYIFEVRRTEGVVEPAVEEYVDDGVYVRLVAGMASLPQEDTDPNARPVADPRYFGWFVICNDRVVLAADKSAATVWGHEGFPGWHPQYNGFMGLCFFDASDPEKLPWTTTKRGVDAANPVYRRAVANMRRLTRTYTSYTDRRKDALEIVRPAETAASAVPVGDLPMKAEMRLPPIPQVPKIRTINIQYKRPADEVKRVAAALGDRFMSARDVGERTYEFYLENYVEDSN